MKTSKTLPHKEIIQRLSYHGIKTKHDKAGALLALDTSSYKGKIILVWIDAPTTANALKTFLGY